MDLLRRAVPSRQHDPSRLYFNRNRGLDDDDEEEEISFEEEDQQLEDQVSVTPSAASSAALLGSKLVVLDASMYYSEEGSVVSGLTIESNPAPIFSAKSLGGSSGLLLNLASLEGDRDEIESLTTQEGDDEEEELASASSSFYSKNDHYFQNEGEIQDAADQPFIFTDEGSPQSPMTIQKLIDSPVSSSLSGIAKRPGYEKFDTPETQLDATKSSPSAPLLEGEESWSNHKERGRLLAQNLLQRWNRTKKDSPKSHGASSSEESTGSSSSVGSSEDFSDSSRDSGSSIDSYGHRSERSSLSENDDSAKQGLFDSEADDEASSSSSHSLDSQDMYDEKSPSPVLSVQSSKSYSRHSRFRRALRKLRNRRRRPRESSADRRPRSSKSSPKGRAQFQWKRRGLFDDDDDDLDESISFATQKAREVEVTETAEESFSDESSPSDCDAQDDDEKRFVDRDKQTTKTSASSDDIKTPLSRHNSDLSNTSQRSSGTPSAWAANIDSDLPVFATSALDARATSEDIAAQLGLGVDAGRLLDRLRLMASDPILIELDHDEEDMPLQARSGVTTKNKRFRIPRLKVGKKITVPHYENYIFRKVRGVLKNKQRKNSGTV